MMRVRTTLTGMQGSPWVNTLNFAEGVGTAAQLNTAVGTFWGAVDALMDSEVSWTTDAEVAQINAATGALEGLTSVTPATGNGSAVGDALPLATQAVLRWRTGQFAFGREIRGRTFIPALVEASNDNGTLLAASAATINSAAAALISDVNSTLVVWSRRADNVATVVTGSVATDFGVLRSRRD